LHEGKCYLAAGNAQTDFIDYLKEHPIISKRASCTGRAVLERRTFQVLDALMDAEYAMPDYQVVANNRTMLGVPLMREGVPLGTITLWKTRVEPFTEKQIELITTFFFGLVFDSRRFRIFDLDPMRHGQSGMESQAVSARCPRNRACGRAQTACRHHPRKSH
jgi:hypothetical protein